MGQALRPDVVDEPPVLQIAGLCKRYGHGEVLRGIDLALMLIEVVALVGCRSVGRDELRRDQPHGVVQGLEQPRPVVGARAGFSADHTGRQRRGQLVLLVALHGWQDQLGLASFIDTMTRKSVLGEVNTNGQNRYGRPLPNELMGDRTSHRGTWLPIAATRLIRDGEVLFIVRANPMPESTQTKLALAQRQLETAIGLFVSRRDRVSAITLAGAADGILHGLVLKAGKQPFADYAMGVRKAMSGETPAKAKYARHINDKLNINDLKHMDEGTSDEVTLDIDISALGSILKAIANHQTLVPEHPNFIQALLQWTWMFYDGKKIVKDEPFVEPAGREVMKWYAARPSEVKEMEARFAKKYQATLKIQDKQPWVPVATNPL